MMKVLLGVVFALGIVVSCSTSSSADFVDEGGITGLWKSRDEKSDTPRALVAIYKYQDKYYGRMLATYDEEGNIKDTILEQKEKAPGVVGNPPYCGMDFVYDVESEGGSDKYKGKIVDPEKGHVYKAEFWRAGDDLIVRGELWVFGKNIPWPRATEKDLPKGFKMEEINKFVPVIPQV